MIRQRLMMMIIFDDAIPFSAILMITLIFAIYGADYADFPFSLTDMPRHDALSLMLHAIH